MFSADQLSAIEGFVGRNYDPNGNKTITIQPYAYTVVFEDLAAGGSGNKNIQIAANADFVLVAPRSFTVIADSGYVADPLVKVLLTDAGSQEQLMSEAISITSYFGQPQRANDTGVLPYPRIISGRSQLNVQVTNYSDILTSSVAYKRLQLDFVGVLVRGF
jgi:hypothetical protein